MEFVGICWNLLEFVEIVGICWNLLEFVGICWNLHYRISQMSRSIFMILDANVQQSTKILGDLLKCTANDKFATHAKR